MLDNALHGLIRYILGARTRQSLLERVAYSFAHAGRRLYMRGTSAQIGICVDVRAEWLLCYPVRCQ